MKYLFNKEILNIISWEHIFRSIEAWESLINFILVKEKLPVSKIENLKPGTNAVFRSGKYVVKIYAPEESGINYSTDYKSEIFAINYALSSGISVPKIITYGEIDDKYFFQYIIMEYINGLDFNEYSVNFNDKEKTKLGARIREITDLFNKQCENFNGIDVIHDRNRHKRWDRYSENFKTERLEYLKSHAFGEKVFVHGDLCYDNLIIDKKDNIHIIDFADSVLAPINYEHGHLAAVLFGFDESYLRGYFGKYNADDIVDLCFNGLIIHDFGGDIVSEKIANADKLFCLNDFRNELNKKTKNNMVKT